MRHPTRPDSTHNGFLARVLSPPVISCIPRRIKSGRLIHPTIHQSHVQCMRGGYMRFREGSWDMAATLSID